MAGVIPAVKRILLVPTTSRSVDAGADFISYYQSSIVRLIDVHIDICICMLVLPTSKFKRLQLTPLAMGAKFASDRNP